ncbi:hypothetical protein FA13DRAFT_1718091 [Coprinellus micaceus]|uniref:Uncharacterized protein n=1 Tax=Coprinellus micaceus TaxID=71717 RepID=A0A4Y7SEZ0_COPMI|nr:hypothetical protein FA13DRAFT_1718091 [Coprinellus micaceus]
MEWLEKKVVVKKPALAPQQLAPAKPVSDRPPALKSTPGPRSKRRRRKVTGKAITVGVVHSPLKAKGVGVRVPAKMSPKWLYSWRRPARIRAHISFHRLSMHATTASLRGCLTSACILIQRRLSASFVRPGSDPAFAMNAGSARTGAEGGSAWIQTAVCPRCDGEGTGYPGDDLTNQASLGPPQTNSGASVPSLCAAIDAQDTALQAELEQVASRLRSVQDIISAIDGSDVIRALTPLIGRT